MAKADHTSGIDFSGLNDEKSIEKARLRLELQHRRKIKKLHQRLETRDRKKRGVEKVTAVSPSTNAQPAAAAASGTAI